MNKILIAAATSSVLLLAGCASGPDEQTKAAMAQVEDLKNQVDVLTKEVAALKSFAFESFRFNSLNHQSNSIGTTNSS